MIPKTIPFSEAEYDRRLQKTRAAMEKAGIEVLCVTDPSNMAWLTGQKMVVVSPMLIYIFCQ